MTPLPDSPGRTRAEAAGPLSYALAAAVHTHRRRLQRLLAEVGLVPGQELLVVELATSPGITQSELVRRLGVGQPTVAKMLTRLERTGVVHRVPDEADGRVTRLHLTDAAAHLADAVVERWQALERQLVAGLTKQQAAHLRELLTIVRADDTTE